MTVRLNEFDKIEWRDVCRAIRPDITDEEFDRDWREFQDLKHAREEIHPAFSGQYS